MPLGLSIAVLLATILHVISAYYTNCGTILVQVRFLQTFAKCPGLGNVTSSHGQNGTDYLDIAIDTGLALAASLFIFFSVRDIVRKRHEPDDA